MKYVSLTIFLLTFSSAFGQIIGKFGSLEEVKQFLQLSDSQVQSLQQNIDQYSQTVSEKQSRIWQVQREIAAETAKEQLDPMALGLRYAEVETTCRDIRSKSAELVTRNQGLLNADQKAKLKILEDAIKLAPIILQAQIFSLVSSGPSVPVFSTGEAILNGLLAAPCSNPGAGLASVLPNSLQKAGTK